jgi:hypothetical protein
MSRIDSKSKVNSIQLSPRARRRNEMIVLNYTGKRVNINEEYLQIKNIKFSNPPEKEIPNQGYIFSYITEDGKKISLSENESKKYIIGVEIEYFVNLKGNRIFFKTYEIYPVFDSFEPQILNIWEKIYKKGSSYKTIKLEFKTDDYEINLQFLPKDCKDAFKEIEREGLNFFVKLQKERPEFFQ